MGLAFVLMWSSAFSSARIIVENAPPLTTLSLRFLISGLIAIALAAASGQSARITRAQWRATIVFGICQNALYLGLFFVAMQWIGAGVASIIASSMPLVVAFLARRFLGERTSLLGTLGLIAGFFGVALIMSTRLGGGADTWGVAICLFAVLGLPVATLVLRNASRGGNGAMIVGLAMPVGAGALIGPALVFESFEVNWSVPLVHAFVYTTLVPGVAATWIWFRLVGRIGGLRAATYHFLNPFFGVGFAAILLGEELWLKDMLGVVIITTGIFAVQMSRLSR